MTALVVLADNLLLALSSLALLGLAGTVLAYKHLLALVTLALAVVAVAPEAVDELAAGIAGGADLCIA